MEFVWIILGVLAVLCILHVLVVGTHRRRAVYAPQIKHPYAHRGLYNAENPENSLSAFRRAVERGVGVELDVRLSADGEVVVFHDENLLRMTGVDRMIRTMTAAELAEVRLGKSEEGIPTFREVLALIDGKVPLLVEIKPARNVGELCRKTAALLAEYGGSYMIESFHPYVLHWFRRHRPDVARGQLSTHFTRADKGFYGLWVIQNLLFNFLTLPDFVAYNYRYRFCYAFLLCRFFYRPYTLAWTVRDEEGLKKSGSFDGIIYENLDEAILTAAGRLPEGVHDPEEEL